MGHDWKVIFLGELWRRTRRGFPAPLFLIFTGLIWSAEAAVPELRVMSFNLWIGGEAGGYRRVARGSRAVRARQNVR